MRRNALDRRTVLKMTAAGVAGVTLAGCSSDGGSGGSEESGSDESGGDEESGGDTEESGGDSGGSEDFGGWLDGVENYDGVVDETGSDEVSVAVGAQGNGGGFAFDPAAVRVDSGTTVVWEWTGDGGQHNVAHTDGEFESETVSEKGHTFEHTFEESGTFEYSCVPHETMGMKGAIVVE
ncbi:halocyanin domain-containing protein [Halorussus salilacus]|uniref:halocyanin domain-containing protein n=1 Tax=Halorussus salilacus TaxID=2953750 RepID=UPI00209F6557|nr:halocyanin domain-containing protein [Halorussus salilacus]USZ67233.1 halocyanin domain-containing protein [Halorussus salilacus]